MKMEKLFTDIPELENTILFGHLSTGRGYIAEITKSGDCIAVHNAPNEWEYPEYDFMKNKYYYVFGPDAKNIKSIDDVPKDAKRIIPFESFHMEEEIQKHLNIFGNLLAVIENSWGENELFVINRDRKFCNICYKPDMFRGVFSSATRDLRKYTFYKYDKWIVKELI